MGACDDPAPYGEAEGEAEGPPDRVHYGGQVRHSVVGEDLSSRCQYLHLHLFVFLQLDHQVLLLLIHFIFCIHEIYKDVVVGSLRAALPARGCLEGGCRGACSSRTAYTRRKSGAVRVASKHEILTTDTTEGDQSSGQPLPSLCDTFEVYMTPLIYLHPKEK